MLNSPEAFELRVEHGLDPRGKTVRAWPSGRDDTENAARRVTGQIAEKSRLGGPMILVHVYFHEDRTLHIATGRRRAVILESERALQRRQVLRPRVAEAVRVKQVLVGVDHGNSKCAPSRRVETSGHKELVRWILSWDAGCRGAGTAKPAREAPRGTPLTAVHDGVAFLAYLELRVFSSCGPMIQSIGYSS